ncbi:pantoate kinase [Haloarcula pellucida]|nr:pantoate kinase [Halomicroarcula pellucida]MBX0346613.1 sugar kinase [Halomicroarcula pellucida]
MSDDARAFVPGHVTGFFTVDRADDPTKTGSRGGGIALSDGVSVTVEPAAETTVELDGERVEMDAVERVLAALRASARVTAETPLPLGAGFGVSGAMALGTALAANAAFDRHLSYNELVTIAHGAEVQAGTGLGDVVGQARGGVPLRLEPGGPQHNDVDAIPARARVEYHTLGELSTADVVGGDTETLTRAGERALSMVVEDPTLDTVTRASRQFSREAELLTEAVQAVIRDVTEAGGDAAMAMLGETVFSFGTGLTDAGYDASVCEVYPPGATVENGPS